MQIEGAGRRLRELREARSWSRKTLEAHSGVSESAIRNYEQGKRLGHDFQPNRRHLLDIARAFGWPDGSEILNVFGFPDMSRQLEREFLNDPEESILAPLSPLERDAVRDITRRIVSLVVADREGGSGR